MLDGFSLPDVALARNKCLIATTDAFLLQNNAFKRIVSVWRYVLQLLWNLFCIVPIFSICTAEASTAYLRYVLEI